METKRRHIAALITSTLTTCAVLAMTLLAAGPVAAAVSLEVGPAGTYVNFYHNDEKYDIGVTAQDPAGTHYYYCREINHFTDYEAGDATAMPDDITSRAIGWLIAHYHGKREFYAHGAISMFVHDHYDVDPDVWKQVRVSVLEAYPQLEERMNAYWEEAMRNTPAKAQVESTFTDGQRSGVMTVQVANSAGDPLAGIPYTVTLNGPAEFDEGGTTVSGTSVAGKTEWPWTATGDGLMSFAVEYAVDGLVSVEGAQAFIRAGGKIQARDETDSFEVAKTFKPEVSTKVVSDIVDKGEVIQDVVTSQIAQDHNGTWPEGVTLQATGWYFDGIAHDDFDEPIAPQSGQSAQDFLDYLQSLGYTPSAYGTAQFDGPGQTQTVTAIDAGGNPYHSVGDAKFGTWLWAFEIDKQSKQAAEYLSEDYVSAFLELREVNSNRMNIDIESTVTEHSALVGAELGDTITVSGFPEDYGSFDGKELYGFEGDNRLAQVTVWWAGDEDNPQNNEQYRPSHAEEPQEDEHHAIVGTWTYPARNGVLRVGGGIPDVDGNPVNITADKPGWYVFVWKFAGDDRISPASSAYDDGWERTYVTEVEAEESKTPMIVTKVSDRTVEVGEEFHDTARVIGEIPEGAYVTFSAYEPVSADAEPGTGEKLLDEERVALDHTLAAQDVTSSNITASQAGYVYWQATIWDADGTMLATHELGEECETVLVEEVEEFEIPPTNPPDSPPEEPEEPVLPYTGSAIGLVSGIGILTLSVGLLMIFGIRRKFDEY